MELSVDTASDLASVAISREGTVLDEITWLCRRNHTVELLPAVDRLLKGADVDKGELTAIFVTTGPGMYTGLRVGIATAKGMARALGLPLLGVGRLELDAYPHERFAGTIVAVHRAGRGDLAWASYEGNPWRELTPPELSKPEELVHGLVAPALVVGEVDEELRALAAAAAGVVCAPATEIGRATSLAALGYERLSGGATAEPALLRPVYLRPLFIQLAARYGMERTLILVKPDGMQRGLAGEIITRLEHRGLRIVGLRMFQMEDSLARRHYAEHEGKPFFGGLISYITSGPIIAAVLEGTGAVDAVRKTMGATNPGKAEPGTIRGDLGLEMGRNLIHGSDSLESAEREIALFFEDSQLYDYGRDIDRWIFEEPA